MTTVVKNFIIEHKDLIEKSDWYSFIYRWYNISVEKPILYSDIEYWSDLVKTFNTCNIDFLGESYSARKSIISQKLTSIFSNILQSRASSKFPEVFQITRDEVIMRLHSKLGIPYTELKSILDSIVMNSLGTHVKKSIYGYIIRTK